MPVGRSFLGGLLSRLFPNRSRRPPSPGPTRTEAERGPRIPAPRYRGVPSYHRLARDLYRPTPAARRDAEEALLQRVPERALPWLVAVLEEGNSYALRSVIRRGRSEREIERAMVAAAFAWQERQEAEEERRRRKKAKKGSGDVGTAHVPKSGRKREDGPKP